MKLSLKVAILLSVVAVNFLSADQEKIVSQLAGVLPEGVQVLEIKPSPIGLF